MGENRNKITAPAAAASAPEQKQKLTQKTKTNKIEQTNTRSNKKEQNRTKNAKSAGKKKHCKNGAEEKKLQAKHHEIIPTTLRERGGPSASTLFQRPQALESHAEIKRKIRDASRFVVWFSERSHMQNARNVMVKAPPVEALTIRAPSR